MQTTNEAILQTEDLYNCFQSETICMFLDKTLLFIETDISLTDLREGKGGTIYCETQMSAEAPYLGGFR